MDNNQYDPTKTSFPYLNSATFSGRLVADPQYTKGQVDGQDRCWFRLASNRPGSDHVDYLPCVCWGSYARAMANHAKKGKVIFVQGELATNNKQLADGTWNNYTEINCHRVSFGADAKNQSQAAPPAAGPRASAPVVASAPAQQATPGVDPAMATALAALAAMLKSNPQAAASLLGSSPEHDPEIPFA